MKVYPVGILTFVLVAALGAVTGGCSEQTPAPGQKAATNQTAAQHAQTLRRIESEIRQLSQQQGTFDEKAVRAKLKSLSDQLATLIKAQATTGRSGDRPPAKDQHPFVPAMRRARKSLARMQTIKDYSAVISKRERIDGKLLEYETMFVKIRHEPFSVYLKFLGPEKLKGREVIYVEGQNDGKLIAHEPPGKTVLARIQNAIVPTAYLNPTSALAMRGNRYPITEIGAMNLLIKLIEVGELDMKHGEAKAKFYSQALVNNRPCVAMRFEHPIRRDHFRFNVAEVFIDKELNVPIRYAAYGWPATPGGLPVLLEEYTYSQVKLNNGFDDEDFNPKNPEYDYPK